MNEILKIEKLNISFMMKEGRVDAVRGVSFGIKAGESLALVGESGCGKTALCRTVLGLHSGHAMTSGKILLDGETNILSLSEEEIEQIRGRRIAMVFQDPMTSLDPTYSVGSQISESIRLHEKISSREAKRRAIELLEMVGIDAPGQRARQYPHHFSGGMRQRVAIAAALALDPDILICDEPTTALDPGTQEQIIGLLQRLQREKNMTMIFVTHDMSIVEKIADHICVMKNGRIVEEGSVCKVMKEPEHEYTKELLFYARYGKGKAHTHGDIHYHGGVAHSHPAKKRELLVSVRDLCKSFELTKGQRRSVLHDFSMDIREGEIVGLVGPSGCGKSTLARIIMGIQKSDAGEVIFHKDINKQIIFQDSASAFNERMTVENIIAEPLLIAGGFRAGKKMTDEIRARVREVMTQAGLEVSLADRHPYDISGGQRQRAAIARALITDPDMIIADEPISSLDVSIQSQIVHLLKELASKRQMTVLLIAHDLPMVEHIADRIITL